MDMVTACSIFLPGRLWMMKDLHNKPNKYTVEQWLEKCYGMKRWKAKSISVYSCTVTNNYIGD
jgi:hypothetical protein